MLKHSSRAGLNDIPMLLKTPAIHHSRRRDMVYLARLNDQQRAFFRNYKILLQNVERAKISVCKSIANWDLNADLTKVGMYPIPVPINPFEPHR
jgi:hypothetical protein